jgi:SWI/SNF-related matrix-associated actin-dependent regulator 1 of chromatin subfamily A
VAVCAPAFLCASLHNGEAVLSFPYEDRLRLLLRAIPGRRWDPVERVWRLPLDPDRAQSLALLLREVPGESQLSPELTRALERHRRRRDFRECLLDLARPDGNWWLSFATDSAPELVHALLEHPQAYSLPPIGRGLLPLDDRAAQTIEALQTPAAQEGTRSVRLRLSRAAQGALVSHGLRAAGERRAARTRAQRPRTSLRTSISTPASTPAHNVDPFGVDALQALLATNARAIAEGSSAVESGGGLGAVESGGGLGAVESGGGLGESEQRHPREAQLVALSAATDSALQVAGLHGELKPFQRAGVRYLLAQRRAFLADEQGLGKTIEALAALQADGAFPAVVVCPASLKLNWLREIERWLPQRSVRVLSGTTLAPVAPAPEITIVNYDILAARLSQLQALAPRALVLDESHYCKNARAKRTRAVARLAAAVPQDGLVLALTGTPVVNNPKELLAQLAILGRLHEFGTGKRFAREFLLDRDTHLRLHWQLRASCFVRRRKSDVLAQLPAKTRSVVPLELDNLPDYRLAEHDIVAWLRSQPLDLRELDAKVAAALRAQRLVRLSALKLLAARGKLAAALVWIHDFLRSGERLVVFAHHREIQQAVLARFPTALHILGGDSHAARDRALRAFQEGEGQLALCSIEVAGQGITLTRASHVAFLELDWTPAKHDQAEDRLHRIGQRDAVNATYLLAARTIDETIAELLERKRAVIGAVTDGRTEEQGSVVDALVRELHARAPYRRLRAVA